MVEGRQSIIKVKDQLMTVVELHEGRSAVLPYPGVLVVFPPRVLLWLVTDNLYTNLPTPGGMKVVTTVVTTHRKVRPSLGLPS